MGDSVGLATHLPRPSLRCAAGVTGFNISLDTLVEAKFGFITRRKGFARVLEGIDAVLEHEHCTVKVNVVAMNGVNEEEFADFVSFTQHKRVAVRFIECAPSSRAHAHRARTRTRASTSASCRAQVATGCADSWPCALPPPQTSLPQVATGCAVALHAPSPPDRTSFSAAAGGFVATMALIRSSATRWMPFGGNAWDQKKFISVPSARPRSMHAGFHLPTEMLSRTKPKPRRLLNRRLGQI